MSPVRLVILLVAAVAAIGAVFLVRSMAAPAPAVAAAKMAPVEAPKPVEIPTKQVLVANHAIPVGKFVSADDLRWQEWPASSPIGAPRPGRAQAASDHIRCHRRRTDEAGRHQRP